jgi:digeranylgeranylglycerophospholipid reductase
MGIFDVAVVGGGPSGLHAASLLAQKGLSVLVAEKKNEIGSNVICTGIVGKELFEEFSLPTGSIIRDLQAVKIVSSSGNTLSYRHPDPFACVVDRQAFDQALADQAEAAGARIQLGTSATDITVGKDSVEIATKAEDGPPASIIA